MECFLLLEGRAKSYSLASTPVRGEQKRHRTKLVTRFTCGGDEGKPAHSLRESATAAAPPGALRAPLANAPRFRSYAPCRVRFPCAGNKKEAPPKRNLLHYLWWRRREVRAFAPRIRDRCGASRRLARSAGKRSAFPQLRALSGSIPVRGEQKRGPAQAEPLTLPVVETKGIEPSASAMRRQRSPS